MQSSPEKKLVRTGGLRDALNLLQDSADGDKFKDLLDKVEDGVREQLIKSRIGAPHAKAAWHTPACIKALKPEGSTLCYQVSERCFEGYYPKPPEFRGKGPNAKQNWSQSRTHGEKWSQLSAPDKLSSSFGRCTGNVARTWA